MNRGRRGGWLAILLVAAMLPLTGCGAPADPPEPPPEELRRLRGPLQVVLGDLDCFATAVTGTADGDIFVAGGNPGDGQVLHYDGLQWRRIHLGVGLLWGIVAFGPRQVIAAGEGGVVYRYDGERWRREPTGTNGHLYGLWGTGADDLWAVGGNVPKQDGVDDQVVLRYTQGAWQRLEAEVTLPVGIPSVTFRGVWGRAPDDVYVVGERGTILRFDGTRLAQVESPTGDPLRGVFGLADGETVLAVSDGDPFGLVVGRSETDAPFLIHVAERGLDLRGGLARAGDEPLVLGAEGYAASFSSVDGLHPIGSVTRADLQAAWADAAGNYVVVGGNLRGSLPGGPAGTVLRLGEPLPTVPLVDVGSGLE